MGCILLPDVNYRYLKYEIYRLFMTEPNIRYHIRELADMNDFSDSAVKGYISDQVNRLQRLNYFSYYNADDDMPQINYQPMPKDSLSFNEADGFIHNKTDILQLNAILNCVRYQITFDFNEDFINLVQVNLLSNLAQITVEELGIDLDELEELYEQEEIDE